MADLTDQVITVRVMVADPVAGAQVTAWRIDGSGARDELPLAHGVTDQAGEVALRIATADRGVLFTSAGGHVREPEAPLRSDIPDRDSRDVTFSEELPLGDLRLSSFLAIDLTTDSDTRRFATLSPITTAAHIMGEHAFSAGGRPGESGEVELRSYFDAIAALNAHWSEHIGEDIVTTRALHIPTASRDIRRTPGHTANQAIALDTPGVRNGLALAALGALGARMAAQTNGSDVIHNSLAVARALLRDASVAAPISPGEPPDDGSDDDGEPQRPPPDNLVIDDVLIGRGPITKPLPSLPLTPIKAGGRRSAVGSSVVLDGIGPDGQLAIGSCPGICQLDVHTWRGQWAAALAFDVVASSARNDTGLTLADDGIQAMVRGMTSNPEPVLFGDAEVGLVGDVIAGEHAPVIEFLPVTLQNELYDQIIFDPVTAAPTHLPPLTPVSLIELGPAGDECPVVYKYVTRLQHSDDNAIRWRFSVAATEEAEAGISIISKAEYRVRTQGADQWLTEFLPAAALTPAEGGLSDVRAVEFEAVLLQSEISDLATIDSQNLEIEVRGYDSLGQVAIGHRCWHHVLLPPPLYISSLRPVPSTRPKALPAHGLEQNNLAGLLNGLSSDQGVAIVELEIKNGTDKPGYIEPVLGASVAHARVSWQQTSAYIFFDDEGLTHQQCRFGEERCTEEFLPIDRPSTLQQDDYRAIDQLISHIEVQDQSSGAPLAPTFCIDCVLYRLEPRRNTEDPRVYRLVLFATDLTALAPRLPGESESDVGGPFLEYGLDPDWALTLTGRRYERIIVCELAFLPCDEATVYRYHRAVISASITAPQMDMVLRLRATRASLPHFEMRAAYSDFHWSTVEPVVPDPHSYNTDTISSLDR